MSLTNLFGCRHRNLSRVFGSRNYLRINGRKHKHYKVCCDCGKQFAYNWEEMRIA